MMKTQPVEEDILLRKLVEGTALFTGAGFFKALVRNLAEAMGVHGAWVTEYDEERRRLRSFAFWLDGDWVEEYEYAVKGTPCESVVDCQGLIHIPDRVVELYPDDPDLPALNAVSYMGVALKDTDRKVLGHLAILDIKPMPKNNHLQSIFRIFAARAAGELQRLRAVQEISKQEAKLRRLFEGAMDAIVEWDEQMKITQLNPAAGRLFKIDPSVVTGEDITSLLTPEGGRKLEETAGRFSRKNHPLPYIWLPDDLTGRDPEGGVIRMEATLTRYEQENRSFFVGIFRNINDRLEAEQKIRSLTIEADSLAEEVRAHFNFDEIIGESPLIRNTLKEVAQVANTEATVLILGETGTGKELFARAVHQASRRAGRPMVKLNCAALPANLIESELFGHEKGAFTGAIAKREGRFSLADKGTIFLDEIGELPLDLQAKLLRVIQEGEFEPLGSSKTAKVDVRIIAATHRHLAEEVQKGNFREDLFYRLNVFPIFIPPLRERGRDVALIASALAEKLARQMGKTLQPLAEPEVQKLLAYSWPGNVRELQNAVERAVILSPNGRLQFDIAPASSSDNSALSDSGAGQPTDRIFTMEELNELEKQNIIRALQAANWKVSGENGAADILGMKPSTLSSRIKALEISRDLVREIS